MNHPEVIALMVTQLAIIAIAAYTLFGEGSIVAANIGIVSLALGYLYWWKKRSE